MGFDIYGTHLPALMAAVASTEGPILECGAGDYSTPILHEIANQSGRFLVTLETDAKWLSKFQDLSGDLHKIILVKNWTDERIIDKEWSVALIDHAPGERRIEEIRRLADLATFIVVHDTETDYATGANYGYEPVFSRFKFRTDYRRYRPYTTVVSNFRKLGLNDRQWKPEDNG